MKEIAIDFPYDQVAAFCHRHQISQLSLFGSVLSQAFNADSDIDVLVTFEPEAQIGFMDLARMQRELSEMLHLPVDFVPANGLKPLIRDEVIAKSQVVYAA